MFVNAVNLSREHVVLYSNNLKPRANFPPN